MVAAIDFTTSESSDSPRNRSATSSSLGQITELSTTDTSFTSLLSPSVPDSASDFRSWNEPGTMHGDNSEATNANGKDKMDTTLESLSLESWSKMRADSDSCCCLLSTIIFLERLVSKSTSRENRIDLLLADVRKAIETLATFVSCKGCAARVEQSMLLAMAARQTSIICGKTADCYKAMHLFEFGDSNLSRLSPELDTSTDTVDVSVATYRVNRRERLHLLKSLVAFQIAECQQHINKIKSLNRIWSDQGQAEALIEAENHIKSARVTINSQ